MTDESSSTMNARFWGQDPRFALIGTDHFPVLLQEYLKGQNYSEDLSKFDGYREQFFALADRRSEAVLVTRDGDEWVMESFHKLSDVEMSGQIFRCKVGPAIASVAEI